MVSINLYAAPGSGKSTTAAYLFSFFKNRGKNIELITEYCKQLVYSKRENEMTNQIYLLAKQYKKMKDIEDYGHVPIVVTDCPLLLGLVYAKQLPYYEEFKNLVCKLHEGFENINVFIRRTKPYNPSGRLQNEQESDLLSPAIKELVKFDYEIDGDERGQEQFAGYLLRHLETRI
jgi:hypothetical protein